MEWNVLLKNSILKFIRPSTSFIFNCDNHKGIILITQLRAVESFAWAQTQAQFSRLFKSNCSCGLDIESTLHFLLHCPALNDERYTLLSTLNKINCKLEELTNTSLLQTLSYGNTLFNKEKHTLILYILDINYLYISVEYISSIKRFEEPLI